MSSKLVDRQLQEKAISGLKKLKNHCKFLIEAGKAEDETKEIKCIARAQPMLPSIHAQVI